jgi:cation/acetate symporter
MMGIFNKRMNKEGAIAGMVAGIGVTLLYVFQHKGIMFIASTSFLGDMPENWFLGIEPNAFGAIGALVNFGVAYAASWKTSVFRMVPARPSVTEIRSRPEKRGQQCPLFFALR